MSKDIITDILLNELAFNGLVITDALDMSAISKYYSPGEAAVNCIQAGADILLMPKNLAEAYTAIEKAVNSGDIPIERIERSVLKILTKKIERNII